MAGKTVRISNEKVKQFVTAVREKYSPKAIYLFGSRARGEEMNHSDWDFIVVSDKFEGMPFRDRIDALLELVDYPVGADIEPLCYTPKEFEHMRSEPTIVKQAVKEGILLSA